MISNIWSICIDLILSNKAKGFCYTLVIETGLSGHHKMTVTVTKSYLPKTKPKPVIYRCYKTFVVDTFRYDLTNDLSASNTTLSYDEFETILS